MRLEIDGYFESNPHRPDLPADALSDTEVLHDFLREQAGNLRRTHNLNQAGDTTFSWDILTKLEDSPRFTLGALGRFFHPTYGMIFARYVLFKNIESGVWEGAPYGITLTGDHFEWIVSNRLDPNLSDLVIGIGASYTLPIDGQYGWVIVNGVNIQELRFENQPTQYARFARGAIGFVESVGETSGPPLGRIIAPPVEADEYWVVPEAGAYIDCMSLQSSQSYLSYFQGVEEAIQQIQLSQEAGTQTLYERVRQIRVDFEQGNNLTGQALRVISDRLTATTGDRTQILQEVRDSMQIIANFAGQASVNAGNAEGAAARSFTQLTATNEFSRTASVAADAAGVYAESATQMRNEATLSRNEAGVSAAAAATSEANAAVSETNAGTSATASQNSATNAATSAGQANISAGQAATSAGNASTSATQASNSATNAAGSASSASSSATTATNAATTATNQANAASTSAGNAATSANQASTSATNAAGSATSASNSATTATNASNTATTQAGIATTQASNASTSASQASTSASNAAGSASAASVSATAASNSSISAQSVANRLIPDRVSVGADFTYDYSNSAHPDNLPILTAGTVVAVTGEGQVRQFTAAQVATVNRGRMPVIAGHTYRSSHRTRITVNGVNQGVSAPAFFLYAADGSFLTTIAWIGINPQAVADGWVTRSLDVSAATILAANANTAFIRAAVDVRKSTDFTESGATWQIAYLSLLDVTSEVNSANSATAAATSALNASTSATAAGTSATSASTSATNAATSASNASTSASQSSTSATNASGSASAAAASATLAANIAQAVLNKNPVFASYAVGATVPVDWLLYAGAAGISKQTGGKFGSDFKHRGAPAALDTLTGIKQNVNLAPNEYFFVEATAELLGGAWTGAGILLQFRDVANAFISSLTIPFNTERSNAGIAPTGLGEFSWSKLFKSPANTSYVEFFLMSNYTVGMGAAVSKTIDWYRAAILPANAAVLTQQLANASSSGNAIAAFEVTTIAGSSSAAIRMRTESSPGVYDSTIALEAEEFQVYNGTTRKLAMKIANGHALFPGDVDVGGAVRIGTLRIPIALQAFQVSAGDGETISFGTDLGNIPTLQFDTSGLAPKAATESYDVKAQSLTSTGFTMRAKIITPSSATNVSNGPGTNTGGSPSWQMQKADAADAYDGNYTFTVQMDVDFSAEAGNPTYEGYASYDCYVRPSGGAWTLIGSVDRLMFQGSGGTQSKTITGSVYYGSAIGQHATNTEFGIVANSGVITAFTSITYTKQTTSGSESSATPSGQKVLVTVIPKNSP